MPRYAHHSGIRPALSCAPPHALDDVSPLPLGCGDLVVMMSEQAWQAFLAAEGGGAWVVLHGGPTAVFRVDSLVAATALANAIVRLPEVTDAEVVMTMTPRQLSVRLSRDVLLLQDDRIQLARAISAAARACGVEADRAVVQEVQLAIAAKPGEVAVDFWRAVLGYMPASDDNGVDPLGHGSTVWMQELDEQKPLQHAMHVDVSLAREQAEPRVQAALAAGGRIVAAESPGLWILADPAGNRVCIASWPDGAPTTTADGQ